MDRFFICGGSFLS